MRVPGETGNETLKASRKLLRPQVERQRRERMSRSVESLRAMLLLQGTPHQGLVTHRVEKAEVLENTVLFLQMCGLRGTGGGAGGGTGGGAGGGAQQQNFQDGFSACLQRASLYLRNEGEGQQVEQALSIALSHHLTHPGLGTTTPISPHSAHAQSKKQSAQLWRHWAAIRISPSRQHRVPLAHAHSHRNQHSHSQPPAPPTDSQSAWRPWS